LVLCLAGTLLRKSYLSSIEIAQVAHRAFRAFGAAGGAGVAAMQDKPVVRIEDEFFGYDLDKFVFDGTHRFAGGEAGAVGNTEDMRIDGHGGLTEGGVEYHIGRFAPHAGQCFEFGAGCWYFTVVFFEQQAA
jgi:hypothetical protein